jgi:hypothetical protein
MTEQERDEGARRFDEEIQRLAELHAVDQIDADTRSPA